MIVKKNMRGGVCVCVCVTRRDVMLLMKLRLIMMLMLRILHKMAKILKNLYKKPCNSVIFVIFL